MPKQWPVIDKHDKNKNCQDTVLLSIRILYQIPNYPHDHTLPVMGLQFLYFFKWSVKKGKWCTGVVFLNWVSEPATADAREGTNVALWALFKANKQRSALSTTQPAPSVLKASLFRQSRNSECPLKVKSKWYLNLEQKISNKQTSKPFKWRTEDRVQSDAAAISDFCPLYTDLYCTYENCPFQEVKIIMNYFTAQCIWESQPCQYLGKKFFWIL